MLYIFLKAQCVWYSIVCALFFSKFNDAPAMREDLQCGMVGVSWSICDGASWSIGKTAIFARTLLFKLKTV